jgi:hypothetical protein
MRRTTLFGALLVFVAAWPGLVHAQTVYDDGQLHTVSGSSGPILLENDGTSLIVASPASIVASSGIQSGTAIVGHVGTTINLLGGQVIGGMEARNSASLSNAGITSNGLFAAFGGYVQGGNATSTNMAGTGLGVFGTADIADGTFQGGNGYVPKMQFGAPGLTSFSGSNYSSTVNISGGMFVGGSGGATNIAIVDPGAGLDLNGNFSISGGTIKGGPGGGFALFASVGQYATQVASITGGTFVGLTGGAVGSSAVVSLLNGSTMNISGGSFADGLQLGEGDNSAINISGGMFNNPSRVLNRLTVDDYSSINFFGSNLSWAGPTSGEKGFAGFLSGTLLDGNSIGVSLNLYSDALLTVTITSGPQGEELTFANLAGSVPEPSSIVTLASGIAGLVLVLAGKQLHRSRSCRLETSPEQGPTWTVLSEAECKTGMT